MRQVYAQSGEVYLGTTYIGNFMTDCNAPPAIASGVTPIENIAESPGSGAPLPGSDGVQPDCSGDPGSGCSVAGGGCTSNSSCCCGDYGLVCQAQNVSNNGTPDIKDICCHTELGGGCNSGDYDCCNMGCLWSTKKCEYFPNWVGSIWAPAVTGSGLVQEFNQLNEYWYVPPAPTNYNDINEELFWNGVTDNNNNIFQPELWFYGNNNNGNGEWQIYCQYVVGDTGAYVDSTPAYWAKEGDQIEGNLNISAPAGNGNGDTWECNVSDKTGGYGSQMTLITTTSTTFNVANVVVMEVHGIAACDGLPNASAEEFQINYVSQKGTGSNGWDEFNSVLTQLSWYSETSPDYNTPDCNYNQYIVTGDGYINPEVTWSP
jgi:hypothetical protein